MITVRRATLDDKPAVFEFIRKAYAGRWQYKIPERWEWEYVRNPFLESPDLPVFIAVAEDGTVVGQTCTLVEPVMIEGREHRLGWSVDTYLLSEYRGQGVGFQLQKANDEANPLFMSLSMSQANRKIKTGLGSVALDPVPEFIRMVRYEPGSVRTALLNRLAPRGRRRTWLNGLLRLTLADRLLSGLLNLRHRWDERGTLPGPDPNIEISAVEAFGAETDALWQRLSPRFHAIVRRDAAYLNWKYVEQPHTGYVRLLARRGGQVMGYLIYRQARPPERNVGIIADLFAAPEDQAMQRALLLHALSDLKSRRVKDALTATTVPEYQQVLIQLGFKQFHEATPMLHCQIEPAECEAAIQPGRWFLSRGDHDWDQYPLAH